MLERGDLGADSSRRSTKQNPAILRDDQGFGLQMVRTVSTPSSGRWGSWGKR